jgi:hypothetical protein
MTSDDPSATEGLAAALGDVTDRTRDLVRVEIDAIRREMREKALASLPAMSMLGLAAGAAIMATASSYRLSLRLLERMLPPAPAATVAVAGYGGLATVAAIAGARRMRQAPIPFPAETASATRDGVADTAAGASRTS